MALILRREKRLVPVNSTTHDVKFVARTPDRGWDIMLFMSQPCWLGLDKPEALAITYEPYEEPRK